MMNRFTLFLLTWPPLESRTRRTDAGQTAAEYALVLLGAATIALLVVAWASRTDAIGRLLDAVFDQILDRSRNS